MSKNCDNCNRELIEDEIFQADEQSFICSRCLFEKPVLTYYKYKHQSYSVFLNMVFRLVFLISGIIFYSHYSDIDYMDPRYILFATCLIISAPYYKLFFSIIFKKSIGLFGYIFDGNDDGSGFRDILVTKDAYGNIVSKEDITSDSSSIFFILNLVLLFFRIMIAYTVSLITALLTFIIIPIQFVLSIYYRIRMKIEKRRLKKDFPRYYNYKLLFDYENPYFEDSKQNKNIKYDNLKVVMNRFYKKI